MNFLGWSQIALVLALVAASATPFGRFINDVFEDRLTFLSPILCRVEKGFKRNSWTILPARAAPRRKNKSLWRDGRSVCSKAARRCCPSTMSQGCGGG